MPMCEAHGEEAASGVLEGISFDLENELQRPMNPYVRKVSPHFERALVQTFRSQFDEANDYERRDALLVEAFPLDRKRVCGETLAYVEDPDNNGRGTHEPPHEAYMRARILLHRHMRLAFEEGADWLGRV